MLKSCKEKSGAVLPIDLSFATTFLAVYLFIKVKGSRPMTYQYLTVEMVNKTKTNGGFIDQKMFKTAGKYGFDSLYLTKMSMQVLGGYINHICTLLRPTCDFVLVTRNGGQHNKLGELMSKLVFDATGLRLAIGRSWRPRAAGRRAQSPRTRNIALLLQGFTIRSSDRARWRAKHTNIWNDCTGKRDQRWK